MKRNSKKGNSTQAEKKSRSTARYVEIRIRLPLEEYERGLPYFEARKNLNKYAVEALREKINRAEANDKAGRMKKLLTDEMILSSVLQHMKETGKLNLIFAEKNDGQKR
jgi:hypothetical protein